MSRWNTPVRCVAQHATSDTYVNNGLLHSGGRDGKVPGNKNTRPIKGLQGWTFSFQVSSLAFNLLSSRKWICLSLPEAGGEVIRPKNIITIFSISGPCGLELRNTGINYVTMNLKTPHRPETGHDRPKTNSLFSSARACHPPRSAHFRDGPLHLCKDPTCDLGAVGCSQTPSSHRHSQSEAFTLHFSATLRHRPRLSCWHELTTPPRPV